MILGFSSYYIFLFISLICFSVFNDKKNIFISFFLVFLILFSGFRYNAGIDYFSYENMILGTYDLSYIEYISRNIIYLARKHNSVWFFFLVSSCFYLICIVYGLKKLGLYNSLSVFLLTTFTLSYLSSFGFVRQYSAIGIVFLSWIFFYERKYIIYFLLGFIGVLLHKSGVVFLLAMILRIFLNKKYPFFLVFSVIIFAFFLLDFAVIFISKLPYVGYYSDYMLNLRFGIFGQKIFVSLLVVFCISSFFEYLFIKQRDDVLIFSKNMIVVGLAFYSLFLPYGEHFSRISYYFIPFFTVWHVRLYKLIGKKSNKVIYLLYLGSIGIFYYFSTLYFAQFATSGDFLNNYEFSIFKY